MIAWRHAPDRPRWWLGALALAERRLPALTRLAPGRALPIALHRRRIYVLPTRFGLVFALMLFVMLLGALSQQQCRRAAHLPDRRRRG